MNALTASQLTALAHIQKTGRCVGSYSQTRNSLVRLGLIDLHGGMSLTERGEALLADFRSALGEEERDDALELVWRNGCQGVSIALFSKVAKALGR